MSHLDRDFIFQTFIFRGDILVAGTAIPFLLEEMECKKLPGLPAIVNCRSLVLSPVGNINKNRLKIFNTLVKYTLIFQFLMSLEPTSQLPIYQVTRPLVAKICSELEDEGIPIMFLPISKFKKKTPSTDPKMEDPRIFFVKSNDFCFSSAFRLEFPRNTKRHPRRVKGWRGKSI